jgi:hypothetical protein
MIGIRVVQTCEGFYKVAYDTRECVTRWRLTGAPLTRECSCCLLNEGVAAVCDTEEDAALIASRLPECAAPLESARKDELATRLL